MRSPRAGRRVLFAVVAAACGSLLFGLAGAAVVLRTGPAGAAAAPTDATTAGPTSPTGPTASDTVPATTTVTRTLNPSSTVTATTTTTVTATTSVTARGTEVVATRTPATATATATATVTRAPARSGGSQTSAAAVAIAIAVLVLAAAGLGYYLVRRERTGSHTGGRDPGDWEQQLSRLQGTARWFGGQADYLADETTPRSERARSWSEARPSIADLEHDLAVAGRSAPDPGRAAQAQALGQAVGALRGRLEDGLRADDPGEAARRALDARRHLDEVLATPPTAAVTPGADPT